MMILKRKSEEKGQDINSPTGKFINTLRWEGKIFLFFIDSIILVKEMLYDPKLRQENKCTITW